MGMRVVQVGFLPVLGKRIRRWDVGDDSYDSFY